jgi:hypothetical protein
MMLGCIMPDHAPMHYKMQAPSQNALMHTTTRNIIRRYMEQEGIQSERQLARSSASHQAPKPVSTTSPAPATVTAPARPRTNSTRGPAKFADLKKFFRFNALMH